MIEGDARDEGALIRALDGCDAVVSSLGTGVGFREVSLLTVATRALVTAMTRSGVRRLACRIRAGRFGSVMGRSGASVRQAAAQQLAGAASETGMGAMASMAAKMRPPRPEENSNPHARSHGIEKS